jgi:hypothetical protein
VTQTAITDDTGIFLTAAGAQTCVNAVRTFWDAIKANLPDEIVFTVSPVVDSYDETDGTLFASTSAAVAPTSVTGTSSAAYMMAAGIKVNLNTGVIRDGRRVRGAIYVVPAASTVYSALGTVGSSIRTSVNTAGTTMMTSLATAQHPLCVWSRERLASATLPQRDGAVSLVNAIEVNEKGAVLRGRRD